MISDLPMDPPDDTAPARWSPESWVDEHGDYLFNYAVVRTRVPAAAADVVQETFLAAWQSRGAYRGTAGERGWLLGILKHKIHDYFRDLSRHQPLAHRELSADEMTADFHSEGRQRGKWTRESVPTVWPRAGENLDHVMFWETFHECCGKLPRQTARAFQLRELDELDTPQICQLLGISENNLWVMLSRARLALRRCLEINWFTKLNE